MSSRVIRIKIGTEEHELVKREQNKTERDMKIRVFEAFAGYGSQCMALDRIKESHPDFDYELVGWSEIMPAPIKAHGIFHPDSADKNYGDICKIDWSVVPDFDLFTYSFPCQAVSNAGLQKGLTEGSGTTSSLLWECRKAVREKRPKYLLMENVKNLLSKRFLPEFTKWRNELTEFGYTNFFQVLNAKDYGVPQNRERVFMVSVRHDGENVDYHFPKKEPLEVCVEDVVEDDADDCFYLNQEQVQKFIGLVDMDKFVDEYEASDSSHYGLRL